MSSNLITLFTLALSLPHFVISIPRVPDGGVLQRAPSTSSPSSDYSQAVQPGQPYPLPQALANIANGSISLPIMGGAGPRADFEITSLGDSYAAAVGTEKYVGGERCLKYNLPYGFLTVVNPTWKAPGGHPVLPGLLHAWNNAACSGETAVDVVAHQILDKPTVNVPNPTYGWRRPFGDPDVATLIAGGDDIDFPGILFNCILGALPPGQSPKRTCSDQRKHTWDLLNSKAYVDDLVKAIDAIMAKGRTRHRGKNFRLYVSGYARFFNAETSGAETNCDQTTFQTSGFLFTRQPLGPHGADDAKLTKQLRKEFNDMADALNAGIKEAVDRFNDPHVKYIDVQTDKDGKDVLAGHRFCEKGVQEPDPNNENLWFHHFPYSGAPPTPGVDQATAAGFADVLAAAWNITVDRENGYAGVNAKYPNFNDFWNAVLENATPDLFHQHGSDGYGTNGLWSYIGNIAQVFHPQFALQGAMTLPLLDQIEIDFRDEFHPPSSQIAAPPPPPPPPPPSHAEDQCGDWYRFLFDSFEIYGKDFDPAKFGADGSTLYEHISHCGKISSWKFENVTGDPHGYQWHANGDLPIGTKSCVGSALVDVGGSSPDGCTGSG